MLLKPEDPGTRLVHPNSIPERPPIHPCQGRATLSHPNMFCHSNDQNEFVCKLKSDLLAHRSCPDFDSVKISQSQIRTKKKRMNRDFLTKAK